MPDSPPRRPVVSSRRLAVLGLLAMLVVALPVSELWRQYRVHLDALVLARDVMEPLGHATATQRALLAHRGSAHAVLSGAADQETPRRQAQQEVETRQAQLSGSLARRRLAYALSEAEALEHDWHALVGAITERRIDAAQSDQSHRLMVEQVLQIIDYCADNLARDAAGDRDLIAAAETLRATSRWPLDAATAARRLQAAREVITDPALRRAAEQAEKAGSALAAVNAARQAAALDQLGQAQRGAELALAQLAEQREDRLHTEFALALCATLAAAAALAGLLLATWRRIKLQAAAAHAAQAGHPQDHAGHYIDDFGPDTDNYDWLLDLEPPVTESRGPARLLMQRLRKFPPAPIDPSNPSGPSGPSDKSDKPAGEPREAP